MIGVGVGTKLFVLELTILLGGYDGPRNGFINWDFEHLVVLPLLLGVCCVIFLHNEFFSFVPPPPQKKKLSPLLEVLDDKFLTSCYSHIVQIN